MSAAQVDLKIEGDEVQVNEHTLTGMRYPDGTILWGSDPKGTVNRNPLAFHHLRERAATRLDWADTLKLRAAEAKVDPDEYAAGHQLVERKIIVSVGSITEVAK